MPTAKISDAELYYEVAGQGNAIVMIHGASGNGQDWANQVKVLSPKYTVVTPDTRGHGRSEAPADENKYSLAIYVNDVYELLNKLGIKKCCLAGHSLGGGIVLEFALAHPDMVAGLILVDTAGRFPITHDVITMRDKLAEVARTQGMEAAFEWDVANNPARAELFKKHPEEKEKAKQRMVSNSVNGFINTWKAIAKWKSDVPERLGEIKVPAIVFWGDEDVGLKDAALTLKNGIANAEFVTVPGVGHNPHYDTPEVFNKALLPFLDKIKW